jgi:hypothetical protein
MIRISKAIVRDEIDLTIASMFSLSLYVGIMTIFDISYILLRK